ncbi:MAG TPA: amidohydrolase family protein [Thermoanaerobaculia bacterium]
MKIRAAAAALALSASLAAGETLVLKGGTVHPVSGPALQNGTVVIRDGKIAALGAAGSAVAIPVDAKVVDVSGRHVYPSLFPPMTSLGLVEISAVRATVDTTELGEINPEARADVAMNFDSELLPVARSAGILIAGVAPLGGLVSGSAAAMKLDGWTREDATLKAPATIVVRWPDLTIDRSPTARTSVRLQEKRRDDAVRQLEEAFEAARAYAKAKAAEGGAGVPRHDADPKLEALVPAVEGKLPVVVGANTVAQIRAAVAWGKRENLRIVIFGGADAWRVAPELAAAKVAVILDTALDLPARTDDPYDARYAAAGILAKAGVEVALNDGAGSTAETARNLLQDAAVSAGFGLPREAAVAAMTLVPARILGVDDRVGSIEPGKDATLIVTDGDILDLRSHVVAAYLDGRALDLTDKQKRLYERYKNRPRAGS